MYIETENEFEILFENLEYSRNTKHFIIFTQYTIF